MSPLTQDGHLLSMYQPTSQVHGIMEGRIDYRRVKVFSWRLKSHHRTWFLGGGKWLYFMKGLQSHLGQMDKSKSDNSVLFPCECGLWQSAQSSLSMLHLHFALLCIDSLINPFVEWLAMTRCSKDASRGLWGSFAKTSDITITPGSQLKPHNFVENSILIHLCFSYENLFALCGLVDAFDQGDNSRREPEFGVCNSITTFHF